MIRRIPLASEWTRCVESRLQYCGEHPMNRFLVLVVGTSLTTLAGGWRPSSAAQDPPPLEAPAAVNPSPAAVPPADAQALPAREAPEQLAAADAEADPNRPVKALTEGPLHEAFLSPARDREPL